MALVRQCLSAIKPSRRVVCFPCQHFPQVSRTRFYRTSSVMSKEQMDELQKNPFFDKYAEKIAKMQKTSPEEFLCRLAAQEGANKVPDTKPKDFFLPSQPKAPSALKDVQKKTLEKLMKVELLHDKTTEEIVEIWTEHWKHKDAISAVIPYETFKIMEKRFVEFNTFLFPLPRDQGYEFIMVQFMGPEAHFSTLINYQAHRENAPECLGMMHYTELAHSKGLVLMVGEYDNKVLGPREAKCLADLLEIYYSRPSERKLGILRKFTQTPHLFQHMELVEEMNSLQIETEAKADQASSS